MFYGLLRKSNVVGPHKVLRSDVKIVSDGVAVCIRSSKTRKKKVDPPRTLVLTRMQGHKLCPVSAIIHLLLMTSVLPSTAPLCMIPRKTGPPMMLTYKAMVDVLRRSVPSDQASGYAAHSYRRGGATYMFSIGMGSEEIRLIGGLEI